ncbi:hypothetical protein C8J57DRAFT_1526216 [Mycena rebaudengoi]|nr:hypothetical protein C8J57DRAFT_1526216 [Mycena rebaudengoi]
MLRQRNVYAPAQEREGVITERVDVPAYFQDDPATNAAVEATDFSYTLHDDSLPAEEEELPADGIAFQARKRYQNSDSPFKTWEESHCDEYLDETLRLEGRGSSVNYSNCGRCENENPTFRCAEQHCHGGAMFYQECTVAKHEALPLHWIEASDRWNGVSFEHTSLKELGLVVQLGHLVGFPCPTSTRAHDVFVVIHTNGVHQIALRFCECDSRISHRQQLMRATWWPATVRDPQTCTTMSALRLFQTMNCLGKISGYDFLRSLELLTNNDGLNPPPSRRSAFMYTIHQYRLTKKMKRAGRGHTDSGIKGTAQGELVPPCRACPHAGINVPPDWDKIDWSKEPEDLSYMYNLLTAQDCNFRLINRNVSSAAKDPIVDDGMGFFVNNELYTQHLANHVSEEEISSCSGFQAMFLANAKRVKGLRTTGLAGVTCTHHNNWMRLGPLQLGERQANMDFILFSALLNRIMLFLILSYDIACQYSKRFWSRMEAMPTAFHLVINRANMWFKGEGCTHGETVEQNWEFLNGAAGSTKMMGPGSWHLTMEDMFGFHNWRRTVSYREVLGRQMAENVEAFNMGLVAEVPEIVAQWKGWVKDWESRQHIDGMESPFEFKNRGHTLKDIRLKLAKEELVLSGAGVEIEREDTPSTFITMGQEIEQAQCILAIDVKAAANPTPTMQIEIMRRRTALMKRIRAFRRLQASYMPNIRAFMTLAQQTMWDGEGGNVAEAIRLFMPSDLTEGSKRNGACAAGLTEVEAVLWEGEALEALEELRQALRTQTMTHRFKVRNATGQRALTRGQGVLRQVAVRIHKAKLRYQYARNQLLRLRSHGGGWEKCLPVLRDEDIRGLNERALTEEEAADAEKLRALGAVIEGGGAKVDVDGNADEQELIEALRVEWCKAYVRTRRWDEDVVLVEEEMRRTIETGGFLARRWRERAMARTRGMDAELAEGLVAYTEEQVARETVTSRMLETKWAGIRRKGIRRKGWAYRARELDASEEVVVLLGTEEFLHGEDPEEAEAEWNEFEDEGNDDMMRGLDVKSGNKNWLFWPKAWKAEGGGRRAEGGGRRAEGGGRRAEGGGRRAEGGGRRAAEGPLMADNSPVARSSSSHSPIPSTPDLRYSPLSTESSSGDRTIQMSSFMGDSMAPAAVATIQDFLASKNLDTAQRTVYISPTLSSIAFEAAFQTPAYGASYPWSEPSDDYTPWCVARRRDLARFAGA